MRRIQRSGLRFTIRPTIARLMPACNPRKQIPGRMVLRIADVTGAGDTVMATVALARSAGATFEQAAHLANYAGGIVVMKRGTATVGADELRHAVTTDRGERPRG